MTMTDVRAAALGEFPAPPCPSWCEADHELKDIRTSTSWSRRHARNWVITVDVSEVYVSLASWDYYFGDSWEHRYPAEIGIGPLAGAVYGRADFKNVVDGLIAVAALISPGVLEAVQAAVLLARSPEVTPAGEDQ